jgi:hypothetical protein
LIFALFSLRLAFVPFGLEPCESTSRQVRRGLIAQATLFAAQMIERNVGSSSHLREVQRFAIG